MVKSEERSGRATHRHDARSGTTDLRGDKLAKAIALAWIDKQVEGWFGQVVAQAKHNNCIFCPMTVRPPRCCPSTSFQPQGGSLWR